MIRIRFYGLAIASQPEGAPRDCRKATNRSGELQVQAVWRRRAAGWLADPACKQGKARAVWDGPFGGAGSDIRRKAPTTETSGMKFRDGDGCKASHAWHLISRQLRKCRCASALQRLCRFCMSTISSDPAEIGVGPGPVQGRVGRLFGMPRHRRQRCAEDTTACQSAAGRLCRFGIKDRSVGCLRQSAQVLRRHETGSVTPTFWLAKGRRPGPHAEDGVNRSVDLPAFCLDLSEIGGILGCWLFGGGRFLPPVGSDSMEWTREA